MPRHDAKYLDDRGLAGRPGEAPFDGLTVYDENQTFVPDSFAALYRDGRGRLSIGLPELARRCELCEDLAQLTTERSAALCVRDGLEEDQVLERTLAGLRNPESGLSHDEARWVVRRTAELLGWAWPARLEA